MKLFIVIVVHVVSVIFASAANAGPPAVQPIERVYEVAVFGHRIGTIDVVREQRQAGGATVNHQTVAVDIEFADKGESYSALVESRITYDDGGLKNYSHRIEENGEHFTIVGHREDDDLRVQAEQIRSGAKKNKELANLIVPMSRFDLSTEELYDALSNLQAGSAELRYRVFNTETLEVERTIISVLRKDSERIGDKVHRCIVVKLDSRNHTREACVARDALGGYLVTETGRDQDGPYRVRLID